MGNPLIPPALTGDFARSDRRHLPAGSSALCIDHELIYEPFFADFGPLNMGQSYRFCEKLDSLVKECEKRQDVDKRGAGPVFFVAQSQPNFRANACVLIGIYQVIDTLYIRIYHD